MKSPKLGWRYRQPETGHEFTPQSSLNALLKSIYGHRLAFPDLDRASGWEARVMSDICAQCPDIPCMDIPDPETNPLVVEGRARWAELHAYALAYPQDPNGGDRDNARRWLDDWRRRIPTYGCRCAENFAPIEAANPFCLDHRNGFYTSTVTIHDLVRAKLGQKLWAAEHAGEIAVNLSS